jgi:hypothetical protein
MPLVLKKLKKLHDCRMFLCWGNVCINHKLACSSCREWPRPGLAEILYHAVYHPTGMRGGS